jgi:hypothetical protein
MSEIMRKKLTGLSDGERNKLVGLEGDDLLTAIDELRQSHSASGHELALEELDAVDPRSNYFKAWQDYQNALSTAEPEALAAIETHLKSLQPLSLSYQQM